jgi:hypothetical protein
LRFGLILAWRLLSFLQPLLLHRVSLFQLLCLLLMPLLYLLLSRFITSLSREPLVVLLLPLLEFLVFLFLLRVELFLLLLVFLVLSNVSRAWRNGPWMRWKVLRVDCIRGARDAVFWSCDRRIAASFNGGAIGCRVIRRSCLFGRYDCAIAKCSRLRGSSDWRLAVIYRSS